MKTETVDVALSQGIGIPLGQILVWGLEAFLLADPIPGQVAIAIGTVIGGAIHYIKSRRDCANDNAISPGGTR